MRYQVLLAAQPGGQMFDPLANPEAPMDAATCWAKLCRIDRTIASNIASANFVMLGTQPTTCRKEILMFANAQLRWNRGAFGIFILMVVIHRTALSQVDTSSTGKGQLGHFHLASDVGSPENAVRRCMMPPRRSSRSAVQGSICGPQQTNSTEYGENSLAT